MKELNFRRVILIVDDDLNIIKLVKEALSSYNCILLEATNLRDAEAMLSTRKPSLVILDWLLPDGSGVKLLDRMRKSSSYKNMPVIMLTSKSTEKDLISGFEHGADDYIVKPFSSTELAKRAEAIMRRLFPLLEEEVALFDDFIINLSQKRLIIEDRSVSLGSIEFNLLMALYKHEGQVLSRDALLAQVWGDDSFVYERTVDVHILRLRNHLGKKFENMIQTIRGVGYRFTKDVFDHGSSIGSKVINKPPSTRRQSSKE